MSNYAFNKEGSRSNVQDLLAKYHPRHLILHLTPYMHPGVSFLTYIEPYIHGKFGSDRLGIGNESAGLVRSIIRCMCVI